MSLATQSDSALSGRPLAWNAWIMPFDSDAAGARNRKVGGIGRAPGGQASPQGRPIPIQRPASAAQE
jgi:hypothetical protein